MITDATWPAKHPYSWTVIGSMDDLSAASLDDVKEWFRTYYGPSNATIAIAGDITAEAARAKVEKYFGETPPGPPVAHFESWVAKMTGSRRQCVEDHVPLARIYKVWNVPAWGKRDEILLRLLADVFHEGRDSRFYKRLVYDEQVATEAFPRGETRRRGTCAPDRGGSHTRGTAASFHRAGCPDHTGAGSRGWLLGANPMFYWRARFTGAIRKHTRSD